MDVNLEGILELVRKATKVDLGRYRRSILERRLAARMRKLGLSTSASYLERLTEDQSECSNLVDAVAINVTSFFRDPLVFDLLGERIIPETLERKRRVSAPEIRIWSAGCGSGEEAWSLAIIVREALKGQISQWAIRIFATDIDRDALARAAAGCYPRESLLTTRLGWVDTYFRPVGQEFQVSPVLRQMVRFSPHDLTSPEGRAPVESVFGAFDLILCRNVLIYFSTETQVQAQANLCRALDGAGFLVLGSSESLLRPDTSGLEAVDRRARIFRKAPGGTARSSGGTRRSGR